jgi:hypothetical protein
MDDNKDRISRDTRKASSIRSYRLKSLSGERKNGKKKSYIYPIEKMIDFIFSFDPDHCYETAKKEFPMR